MNEVYVTPDIPPIEFDFFAYLIMENFPQYRYSDVAELSYYRINSILNYIRERNIRERNKAFNPETAKPKGTSCIGIADAINKAREMEKRKSEIDGQNI